MTELAFERIEYSVVETGKAIRRALREAFPGVKFSLRGSRGTGYGWFSLSWEDGPTFRQVDAVTNGFRSSYFDGMDDSTHSIPATMYAGADGVVREHRFHCSGVNTQRDYSDAAKAWAAEYVAAVGGVDSFGDCYGDADRAAWRVLQGVDLTGVDFAVLPVPARGFTGRHVPDSYCLEKRVNDWADEYAGAHRGERVAS